MKQAVKNNQQQVLVSSQPQQKKTNNLKNLNLRLYLLQNNYFHVSGKQVKTKVSQNTTKNTSTKPSTK